jgi:hypothetical protein
MRDQMRGKRVAVIGHFLSMERVAEIRNLSILKWVPAIVEPLVNELNSAPCRRGQSLTTVGGGTLTMGGVTAGHCGSLPDCLAHLRPLHILRRSRASATQAHP